MRSTPLSLLPSLTVPALTEEDRVRNIEVVLAALPPPGASAPQVRTVLAENHVFTASSSVYLLLPFCLFYTHKFSLFRLLLSCSCTGTIAEKPCLGQGGRPGLSIADPHPPLPPGSPVGRASLPTARCRPSRSSPPLL